MKPYGWKRTGNVWRKALRTASKTMRLELALSHIKRRRVRAA